MRWLSFCYNESMPNPIIDLRKLREELKGVPDPEIELAPPPEGLLLEAGTAPTTEAERHKTSPGGLLLEWDAPEFEHTAEGGLFLFLIGAVLAIGGVGALFFKNFLFGVFLLLAGGLTISYAYRMPRQIRFAVTSRGITIGNRVYEFEGLQSFWIFYDPPLFKELNLESKKTLMPRVRVPLGDLDPLRLREILLPFLRETKHEESMIDVISKRLGF